MTLDKLLRGVRSLVLSSALAYSACGGGGGGDECERDSDCEGDRVCERDPNNGERYCASPSEGEAEGEGEGETQWYDELCENFRDYVFQNPSLYPPPEEVYKNCLNVCSPPILDSNLYSCVDAYCLIEVDGNDCLDTDNPNPRYARCMTELGFPKKSIKAGYCFK